MSNMYQLKIIYNIIVLTLIRCSGESNTCSSYCSQTQKRESLPAASRTALLISSFSVIRSGGGGALGIDTSKDTIRQHLLLMKRII